MNCHFYVHFFHMPNTAIYSFSAVWLFVFCYPVFFLFPLPLPVKGFHIWLGIKLDLGWVDVLVGRDQWVHWDEASLWRLMSLPACLPQHVRRTFSIRHKEETHPSRAWMMLRTLRRLDKPSHSLVRSFWMGGKAQRVGCMKNRKIPQCPTFLASLHKLMGNLREFICLILSQPSSSKV